MEHGKPVQLGQRRCAEKIKRREGATPNVQSGEGAELRKHLCMLTLSFRSLATKPEASRRSDVHSLWLASCSRTTESPAISASAAERVWLARSGERKT